MDGILEFFWDWSDHGNVSHVAANGLTPEQCEQVVRRGFKDRQVNRTDPQRWIVEDFTDAGLSVVVSFELEWIEELNCWGITPVTAFECEWTLWP